MINPFEMRSLMQQAETGVMPHVGDMSQADAVIGFAFGIRFDDYGNLRSPGPVNEALAHFIVNDEEVRNKPMVLQDILGLEVIRLDRSLKPQIDVKPTIKRPGQAYSSYEFLVIQTMPDLVADHVGSLAVVAQPRHQPRDVAISKQAGFTTFAPDTSSVDIFDPHSSQPWIRSKEAWIRRERKVIVASALTGKI